jgi:hypothetical protein
VASLYLVTERQTDFGYSTSDSGSAHVRIRQANRPVAGCRKSAEVSLD